MAEASIDIRIYPHKEMTSVDMAELLEGISFGNDVLYGCDVTVVNGIINISSGRILVGGRLGVVAGGTITPPTTFTVPTTCDLYAICDLSNTDNPFYFRFLTTEDIQQMFPYPAEEVEHDYFPDFNEANGIAGLDFGQCTVDPATGLVSNWITSSDDAVAYSTFTKGYQRYRDLLWRCRRLENTWSANPQVMTDGITIVQNETTLRKNGTVVECKLRFTVTASRPLPADKTLFKIPELYRPVSVLRIIAHDWDLGQPRRFHLFNNGDFKTTDELPVGLQFIISFVYMTDGSVVPGEH